MLPCNNVEYYVIAMKMPAHLELLSHKVFLIYSEDHYGLTACFYVNIIEMINQCQLCSGN